MKKTFKFLFLYILAKKIKDGVWMSCAGYTWRTRLILPALDIEQRCRSASPSNVFPSNRHNTARQTISLRSGATLSCHVLLEKVHKFYTK